MQTAEVCPADANPVTCMDNMDSELVNLGRELVSLRNRVAASAASAPTDQPAWAANQKLQTSITLCLGADCVSQGAGSGEANGGGKRRRLQSFSCSGPSQLKARSRDVNSMCCPEGNCSEGMPMDCSLACATVRPPMQPVQQ